MSEQDDLREQLAKLTHDQWSGWMQYVFGKIYPSRNGTYRMRVREADRWKRQMNTPYADLTEVEKDSDRKEADRILELLAASARPEAAAPIHVDEESRCAICGWTLAETRELGCRPGDCSMRPFPNYFYAPARAKREYCGHLDNDPRANPTVAGGAIPAPREQCVCFIDDGLVQEWVAKAREVAKSKGLAAAESSRLTLREKIEALREQWIRDGEAMLGQIGHKTHLLNRCADELAAVLALLPPGGEPKE